VWHDVVTDAKRKVAETLDEYRGQYAYNLLDEPLRRFAARVAQWDDHEVRSNWYPGQVIEDPRYTERRADVLAARGRRAFLEYNPMAPPTPDGEGRIYRRIAHGPLLDLFVLDMRTYKDPNSANRYADPDRGLLGAEQRAWLKHALASSRATWKVLALELPLGLVVADGPAAFEGVAQGDPGAARGRELEFADVLGFAHRRDIGGIVMLTADVHHTSAHHYDPARAATRDFTPFWEFVSGPLNAGAFPANPLDATFGPERVFVAAPDGPASPADGHQYFGHVAVDGATRMMRVTLRDLDGRVLFGVDLDPA
jgi:alkaline phosphatase D